MTTLIDSYGPKKLAEALGWLMKIGEDDTTGIRSELSDLLFHTSATLKSLGELIERLYDIKKENFNMDSYSTVYWHITNNYTNSYAAQMARSHCTDIERDIERIKFKLARVLRTELGQWSSVDEAFKDISDADNDFLRNFENDMAHIQGQLDKIMTLVDEDEEQAWRFYDQLRKRLMSDLSELRAELTVMRTAEDHIRRYLT